MIDSDKNQGQGNVQQIYSQGYQKKDNFSLRKIICCLNNPLVLVVLFSIIFIVQNVTAYIYKQQSFHSPIAQYDVVFLNTTTALCLDGSPAAYHISKLGDPNKIYLHFQGGGWCQGTSYQDTLEECYQRSKTRLGSSLYNPESNLTQYNSGVMSSDKKNNFRDWKKVKFLYCDGSGHQGTKLQPIQYKDTKLYFRGHNITVQTLNDLQKKIGLFSKASQVIVGGESAGGLATNFIKQRVKKGRVRVVSDCGIFFDSYNIVTKTPLLSLQYKSLMQIVNKQIDPPVPECIKNHPLEKQKCMFAQNIISEIKSPIFSIQALYDAWSVNNILGIKCMIELSLENCSDDEKKVIEQYRMNVLNIIDNLRKNTKNGAWAIASYIHTYTVNSGYYNENFRIPSGSQNSISFAVQNWLKNSTSTHFYIDEKK